MTLEQIDATLAEWQGKLNLASSNLLELDDLFTYKRLRGTAGDGLVGITKDKVRPALAAMDQLWQSLGLLTDTLNHAQALRKSASRLWPSERSLRDIDQLLSGPSVLMPTAPAPLAQRELLSVADSTVSLTPLQLLTTMMGAFDATKNTILAIDAAWNRLEPLLAEADTEAARLTAQADALGETTPPDLLAARRKIDFLRARVETDPLGVHTDFNAEMAPLLARARVWLDELTRQRDAVRADLGRARRLLQELGDLNRQCVAAHACCQSAIVTAKPVPPPLPAASVSDLGVWLDSLDAALGQGKWKPVRIGLDRWLQTTQADLVAERASLVSNTAPMEACDELRGCLASLRVKAQAYAARGLTPDPALDALAGEADRLLKCRPTPLDEAAPLVSEYEARLAQRLKAVKSAA